MPKASTFTYSSTYPCSAAHLHAWHGRPGALERLLPPWEKTRVLSREGGLDAGGEVELLLKLGIFPLRYVAHHTTNIPGKMFRDIQAKGPFASWSHSHFFTDTEHGARLDDVVEYRLPGHNLLPGFVKRNVEKRLLRMFRHRESIIQADIRLHNICSTRPMRLLMSGASGVLGRELVPLLTTGGHAVYRLVRRPPDTRKNEIFWDPDSNILDPGQIPEVDGVIHLAGEYIGLYRWTEEKKRKVLDSRVRGTTLLARTVAGLPIKPGVFLSASAVGYYGNCGDRIIDENGPPGRDFISEVCRQWEQAATPAQLAGIRTIRMRLGIGVTPRGGALERILDTSPGGFIRRFGSGQQYISWMSYDDMISAMLHCLVHSGLSGPVNIAAPQPVTNSELMALLAKITGKPLLMPIPAWLLRLIYGQMASEIVLSGCRVATKKLTDSGFVFRHVSLHQALTQLLGRPGPEPMQ